MAANSSQPSERRVVWFIEVAGDDATWRPFYKSAEVVNRRILFAPDAASADKLPPAAIA